MERKILEMTMLLDFYGEAITEKQRMCVDMYYNENLSMSEISEIVGITRQGVRDMLVRAEVAMQDMENKLGIVKRFLIRRETVEKVEEKLRELSDLTDDRGKQLTEEIMLNILEMEN